MQVEAFVASLLGGVMAGAAGRRFATLRADEQVFMWVDLSLSMTGAHTLTRFSLL